MKSGKGENRPSMRNRLILSLGSIGAILFLSGVISILEYRRMSSYVSELIASNIHSINVSQKLSDLTAEYNHQMLAVVVQNDISIMPDFNLEYFMAQSDTLKKSICSPHVLPMVDSVANSFDRFVETSLKFDEVFLADTVNTGKWFFGSLQPCYNKFSKDIGVLNEAIYEELQKNSKDFDSGFYRSIIPGVVSVSAGILLVVLLLYFIMVNYVNPICRMSDAIDHYRQSGRRYNFTFDGDDQLANINSGLTEIVEDNIELKRRVKSLREDREKMLESISGNN